jgi:predicted double-glycine peptidase
MPQKPSIFAKLSVTAYVLIGIALIFLLVLLGIGALLILRFSSHAVSRYIQDHNTHTSTVAITAPIVSTTTLPVSKELEDGYFISQTFNNCGPSALSMDLSYYGVHVSQETLADDLRPTHNTTGKDDDKSTTPEEIVAEAGKYGFTAYYRPNGSIQLLKDFIANGIPVMTRTLFIPTEDFGHYRVIKGYDDRTDTIIDEDGFQGPEVKYSYANFMSLWQEYNYEYIVLVPPGKGALVQSIIGKDMNTNTAWENAKTVAESQGDIFNESVADYYLGNYADSVSEFEKAEPTLSQHTLWYQMEPIESYYEIGNYPKVFSLAQSILTNGDAIYPELYVLEGEAYEKEGDTAAANTAFATALQYNKNLPNIDAVAKAVFTQYNVSY